MKFKMPKRNNPFGEISPLELKIHVGKKEVDTGALQPENMKDVYEKTRNLLYKGAQKTISNHREDANSNHIFEWQLLSFNSDVSFSLLPGQMHFDRRCQLTFPSSSSSSSSSDSKHGEETKSKIFYLHNASSQDKDHSQSCQSCVSAVAAANLRCNFCEKHLCLKCAFHCCCCAGEFCDLCSVVDYTESVEKSVCLNCRG